MDHGGRPSTGRSTCAWAQGLAVVCAGVLAFGGVAVAAPQSDPGPPEQAQGNGPPAQAPAPQANSQAKQHARGTTPTSRAGTRGKPAGGNAGARGSGQATAGGQGSSGSQGQARGHAKVGNSNSQEASSNGNAGKRTICHATHSSTNPYVEITVSNNAIPAHDRHQDDEDIIPAAAGGCPGGSGVEEHGSAGEHGKVTICHATGSETNPFVRITVSENALPAHTRHQDGEDIVNPQGDCPSSAVPAGVGNPPSGIVSGNTQLAGVPESGQAPSSGVMGVSEESGTSPAEEGGVEGATQIAETGGGSLPFTGLGLGLLVALGALLGVTGLVLRRRTAE